MTKVFNDLVLVYFIGTVNDAGIKLRCIRETRKTLSVSVAYNKD